MATESAGIGLGHAVVLLAAAVIAAPLFRKLGLGAVLGYLCAGLLIGPFGLAFFHDPQAILHVAELGVVLFLFLIGLEMRPTRLWALRNPTACSFINTRSRIISSGRSVCSRIGKARLSYTDKSVNNPLT